MQRWKSFVLNHWRTKLASLVLAALVWLVLRHAITPPRADLAPGADPAPAQIR